MKILIDMNLSPSWVLFLAAHGFEAKRWSALGSLSAPDAKILSFAAAGGYIVLTHDLVFGMLLAARGSNAPSVIQVRAQDVLPDAIGEIVIRAIKGAETQLKLGALVTVDPIRQRIRMLPI